MKLVPCFRPPNTWPASLVAQVQDAFAKGSQVMARQALRMLADLPSEQQGRAFTLGVCGTFTAQPLAEFVRLGLAALPTRPTLVHGDLDNIEQDLLDVSSQIHAAAPDAIVVFWRMEELAPQLLERPWGKSASERRATADAVIGRLKFLVESYAERFSIPLFLSSLPAPAIPGRFLADGHAKSGIAVLRHQLNLAILELATEFKCCHLFDFSAWAEQAGVTAWDVRMDLFARQPIAASAIPGFALHLSRTLAPLVMPPRKVLALDLDNTLWGGVLGEDGVTGLKVGHDFPGKVFRRIQLAALSLKDQGVLLALVSKNNHQDVVQAFAAMPDMPLKLSDFSAVRANWHAKSDNLAAIARELNLGLDSFVFVDDMAFEREEVTCTLPEVAVLQNTGEPLSILDAIFSCPLFDAYRVTGEDLLRSDDYASQKQRQDLLKTSGNISDYLRSLDLKAEIKELDAAGLGRAVQMLAKTNQFNVATRRHSEADVQRMLSTGKNLLLTLSLRDRFGDQGVVGLVIALAVEEDEAMVDTFLLSCRALGRGAEDALWAVLVRRLSEKGFSTLRAAYVPSGKNIQCRQLFDRLGMMLESDVLKEEAVDSERHYVLALPSVPAVPDWLSVTEL